jgi:hypothetical protein
MAGDEQAAGGFAAESLIGAGDESDCHEHTLGSDADTLALIGVLGLQDL